MDTLIPAEQSKATLPGPAPVSQELNLPASNPPSGASLYTVPVEHQQTSP